MSDDISDGQINVPQPPKSGFEAFKGTPPAIILGGVIALAITFVMFWTGMYLSCCFFMGLVLVALVLYYIPKVFGTEKLYQFVVIGVAFFVIMTALGTLVVSKNMINDSSIDNGENAGNGWYDIQYKPDVENGTIEITYKGDKFAGEETKAGYIYIKSVDKVCYRNVLGSFYDSDRHKGEPTDVPGTTNYKFTFSNLKLEEHKLYVFEFCIYNVEKTGEETKVKDLVSGSVSTLHLYKGLANDGDLQNIAFNGNVYWVGICTIIYFVMLVLMHFMHAYLDKTRARLEAEGRLYPQGYGRCKECGTIVLPGETCCRKCGAYVDIPDELRVKKVDSFHCSECGAEVPGDSVCCPRCGAKFDEADETVVVDKDGQENTITVETPVTEVPKDETPAEPEVKQSEEEKKQ